MNEFISSNSELSKNQMSSVDKFEVKKNVSLQQQGLHFFKNK